MLPKFLNPKKKGIMFQAKQAIVDLKILVTVAIQDNSVRPLEDLFSINS